MSSPDPRLLDLSGDLVIHAARLHRAVQRRNTDSPSTGMRVLSLLDEAGPATVTRLAELDRSSQATMSGAVADLVDRGWATKVPHPDDARCAVVTPTAAGDLALADVRRRNAEVVASRIARRGLHGAADLATAVAVLRDVLATDHGLATAGHAEGDL